MDGFGIVLFVWGIFFFVALLPGYLFGYLISQLPIHFGWTVPLSALMAAYLGSLVSQEIVPVASSEIRMSNIGLFSPPIFAAIMVGVYWTRRLSSSRN
jgi:hypothetical protein